MDFLFIILIAPILGVLWFLNLVVLLQKLKKDKDTSNQVILGAVLTFFFILAIMFPFIGAL